LRVTPTIAVGVATRVWEIADIIDLLDMPEAQAAQRQMALS